MVERHAILVGGMKCGTTSLNAYIRQHPEIASPKRARDVHFFSSDENWAQGWGWYDAHWGFDPAQHRVRYESTTQYAKFPQYPHVAKRMAELPGELKLLYLLRDPFERIESHLAHNVARGHATFEEFRKTLPRAIQFSKYAMQIEKFREHLPEAEILLLDFNELKRDPASLLGKVEVYLGVGAWEYELVQPRNTRKSVHGSDQVKLTDADRAKIMPELAEDVRRLRDVHGFDVSAWRVDLDAAPPARSSPTTPAAAAAPRVAAQPKSARKEPQVTIAKHRHAKRGAVSFTFDDGMRSHLDFAIPALELFGFRGTFFVIGGRVRDGDAAAPFWKGEPYDTDWSEWRAAQANGHEIGNHTWSHPESLTELDDEQLAVDVNVSFDKLSAALGRPPFSFAYPRQRSDERVRAAVLARHRAARDDYKAYNHERENFSPERLDARIDLAITRAAWFTPVLHVVTGPCNSADTTTEEVLLGHLEHVKRREPRLWVDTFGRIVRYYRQREAATLDVTPQAEGLTVKLGSGVSYPDYREPLTLVVDAPARGVAAQSVESRTPLPVRPLGDQFLVDVVPNTGAVALTWRY